MKSGAVAGRKRKSEKEAKHATADQMSSAHTPKRQRQEKAVENTPPTSSEDRSNGSDKSLKARVDNVLSKYGEPPLKGLVHEKLPASQFVLAHILNALLSSTRISHTLAAKTLSCLVDENYHDIHVLHKTSWQERTEVLTAGGFTHYREKTATYLGDLAELIKTKYDDDASELLPYPSKQPEAEMNKEGSVTLLKTRLEEIKGLGPMGIDIFLGSIQGFFAYVAPFLDSRSRETANAIGLGDEVDGLYAAVDGDASRMAELQVALTTIRLEKLENEFA
ncbi:putative d-amino acid oxidase protein [Phaeoacremonium minimum UCRPA7]|uniref:Putative d-amino acid oxidase protein n=1 Tax=Phaeoacremonium minimum (strain UCR-PA7) TaxID=1286976 RepID=R8BVI0_PHAM7|nr:putative d-amino acid oxidase protein [Phaeoacremonium minimum UCRPA7]EOO03358.1 putative d-amino acid oxidase protein [Phaeoacremonium minimum UCRPA7]